MSFLSKRTIKQVLGEIPFTAEVYWQLRQQGRPLNKSFSLAKLERALPSWSEQAARARKQSSAAGFQPRRILIFATLRYWIEHAALLGMTLAGLGHEVTLAYLPYANFRLPLNRFDLRRQNAYARKVFSQAQPLLQAVSFLDVRPAGQGKLPAELANVVQDVSLRDAQYTLQKESVEVENELYQLRLERNFQAARAAYEWMQADRPDVLVTPNGSIMEMGAVYQVARSLEIPIVTYEFGEQRERIWLARNAEVMRQETGELWQARQDCPLDEEQWQQVKSLFASRQQASLWENFSRRWQGLPSQGGEKVRLALGLDGPDGRPVVLLAANVIGDSLTLGRQVFTHSMTEWLQRTVQFFTARPDVQLVVRIHPGERYTKGPSVGDVVRQALPEIPAHIHLVEAGDPINTYDLVEIADLGLVYTTTVGMEMAMSGVPVIVSGQTHYREKSFTLDPVSWDSYFELLVAVLEQPGRYRLSREQVEQAWNYAYRFFFEYPVPFPWHLLNFWEELKDWPVDRVLGAEGQAQFGETFRLLAGGPRQWDQAPAAGNTN